MINKHSSILIFIAIIFGILFLFSGRNDTKKKDSLLVQGAIFNSTQAYILPLAEPSYIPILNANVAEPSIDAKSGVVFDTRSGRFLFDKDSRLRLPIASLTKIMVAIVVIENLDLTTVTTVPSLAVKVDNEKQDLYAGESLRIDDLLKIMLIESSNDAAYTIAAYSETKNIQLVEYMNQKAGDLGMINTHFLDPAGLNDEGYSTVEDLVKMTRYALRYQSLWKILTEKEATVKSTDGKITHDLKNTDQLLGIIPNIIGGKTGNTDNALGCMILLVSIPEKNDTLISIVLGSKDRFGDTEKLINWVKSAYRWE